MNKNLGFTIIEFIIVIAIMALTLPMVFGLYLISIQNQQKAHIVRIVKENGDNALATMETLIRNRAVSIYDPLDYSTKICENNTDTYVIGNAVSFKDKSGTFFTFSENNEDLESVKISSASATSSHVLIATHDLTSSKVTITNVEFSCIRPTTFSPPIITVSFTVSQKGETVRHEEKNALEYETSIKLRN